MPVISHNISFEDARAILTHADIYPNIADDMSGPAENFELPDNFTPVVAYVDYEPALCVTLKQLNGIKWDIHVQVLPEFRSMSNELGTITMGWLWMNTTAQKFVADIAVTYPNVKAYAESMGFVEEGLSKSSILLNGKLTDQWLMGISKWA